LFHVSEQIFSHWLKQGTQINYGAPEQGWQSGNESWMHFSSSPL
jgi:hypothetical protein